MRWHLIGHGHLRHKPCRYDGQNDWQRILLQDRCLPLVLSLNLFFLELSPPLPVCHSWRPLRLPGFHAHAFHGVGQLGMISEEERMRKGQRDKTAADFFSGLFESPIYVK